MNEAEESRQVATVRMFWDLISLIAHKAAGEQVEFEIADLELKMCRCWVGADIYKMASTLDCLAKSVFETIHELPEK